MNTKLNKSDWLLIGAFYTIAIILNVIDYKSRNLDLLEFYIDIPSGIITAIAIILIFFYVLIPKILLEKKQYFLFFILAFLTLAIFGIIDDTLGYWSAGKDLKKLPAWYKVIINGIYTSANSTGLVFSLLLTKKFYEGQTDLLKVQKKQKENELKLLRSQLDPHFLFNNLNTLDALIDTNPTKAKEYINRLSLIYRYLIQTKDSEVMELSEELTLAENYIFLIKTRFENDYDFTIEKQTLVDDKFIPTGALQTLLENVVKHNKVQNENTIHTKIVIDDEKLKITNQKSKLRSTNPSFGTGLENLKTRYKLLTDKEVLIKNLEDSFSVAIPVINLDA